MRQEAVDVDQLRLARPLGGTADVPQVCDECGASAEHARGQVAPLPRTHLGVVGRRERLSLVEQRPQLVGVIAAPGTVDAQGERP